MKQTIRPMLGINADLDKIKFPVYASPKLDGVRAIITEEGVMSRSGKRIPNKHVQELFKHLVGFDGELIVGDPTASNVFNTTTSSVTRIEGTPKVTLYVFDYWKGEAGIYDRYCILKGSGLEENRNIDNVFLIKQTLIKNAED